jgi:hypothetical protein
LGIFYHRELSFSEISHNCPHLVPITTKFTSLSPNSLLGQVEQHTAQINLPEGNSESSYTPTTCRFQLIPTSFTNTLAARGLPLLSIILLVKISLFRNFADSKKLLGIYSQTKVYKSEINTIS